MTLILVNKPFGVLCQFTDRAGRPTLADLVPVRDVYPAGRLDHDSEGLVVLTDDGHENLTTTVPKEIDEIEAVCAEASSLPRP